MGLPGAPGPLPLAWAAAQAWWTALRRGPVTAVVDGHRLVCILAGRTRCLSTSDSRLFIALGAANRADRIEIRWPSGASQEWIDVEADRFPEARKGSATLRPRVGRNGLICPQQSSVRQGSTCYEKLRFSPLAATQSLNILSRPETLNASGSRRLPGGHQPQCPFSP